MSRKTYLVAYDVSNPARLNRVYRYLIGYKVEGQKSVFEIWVTVAELRKIKNDLKDIINKKDDRLHVIELDERMQPHCYGVATHFKQDFRSEEHTSELQSR